MNGNAQPQQLPRCQRQLEKFLYETSIPKDFVSTKQLTLLDLRKRLNEFGLRLAVPLEQSVNRIGSDTSLAN